MKNAEMKRNTIRDYEALISDDATEYVKDTIENGIDGFSNDFTGESRQTCFVTLYDNKELIGGLRAESVGALFYIKHLWVDEDYRGQGLGKGLMEKAEQEAERRGCTTFWVDTLSYQAPEFYKKLGYTEMAIISRFRGEHDRIFLRKDV